MTAHCEVAPVIVDSSLLPVASRGALRSQCVTRILMRPLMRHLRLTPRGLVFLRFITDLPTRFTRLVPGTRVEMVRTDGVRGEWVSAPGVRRDAGVILYVHGSAFVILSARSHRALVSRISDRTGVPVFSVDYRLAPEHPFPAAADDVAAAYTYLIGEGFEPNNIVIAGDSAGGHLGVDLALTLARSGASTPAGLVLLSPLMDLTLARAAAQEEHLQDPLISAADCRRLIDLYLADADREDARIALDIADGVDFPPTLIQAGGNEMLRADAQHLHDLLAAHGATAHLQIWPQQAHVFQASLGLPESAAALRQAGMFVHHVLHHVSATTGG